MSRRPRVPYRWDLVWRAERLRQMAVKVAATVMYICRQDRDGAILLFLTGWDVISKLLEKVTANILLGDSSKFLVLPLHGSMPTIDLREIFDRLLNNSGKAKETSQDACWLAIYHPGYPGLQPIEGRAGCVQPGVCLAENNSKCLEGTFTSPSRSVLDFDAEIKGRTPVSTSQWGEMEGLPRRSSRCTIRTYGLVTSHEGRSIAAVKVFGRPMLMAVIFDKLSLLRP